MVTLEAVFTSVPPLMLTLPVDRLEPLAPPDETCKVPALIVVPPVNVLAPDSVNVLDDVSLRSEPYPLITPDKV